MSAGLCDRCVHQRLVRNTRGSVFSLCRRAKAEPERFPRYPRLPVRDCVGFAAVAQSTVTALSITAVKGTRLRTVDRVLLDADGAAGDRRFFVIDERERMLNGKHLPELMSVVSEFDEPAGRLALSFADGTRVEGEVEGEVDGGVAIDARAYGGFRTGELVGGPFAAALSDHVGRPLRLVRTRAGVDRGTRGAVSLISRGSLGRLAEQAGVGGIDARRFRMLIEIDGVQAHAEDRWVGREARVGEALVRFEGHVGRCLVTSRDPESGELTLPTLDLLRAYRGGLETSEPLAFGIYGRVLEGGAVRLGDPVGLS